MAFEAVGRRDLGDIVADQLRGAILRGDFEPGDSLPSENSLALQFGVNRTTLRDALRELEHLGLIDRRQGSRARVLDWHSTGSVALLRYLISPDDPALTYETELANTLIDVIEGFFLVAANAVTAASIPLDNVKERFAAMRAASRSADAAQIEAELRLLCDAFFDATGSVAFALLWNTFVRILEGELDPEMTMLHTIARDIAVNGKVVEILQSLEAALDSRNQAEARRVVDDLFVHIKEIARASFGPNPKSSAETKNEVQLT